MMELEAGVGHSALTNTVLFSFSFTSYAFTPYVCSYMHHSQAQRREDNLQETWSLPSPMCVQRMELRLSA